jgi:hypothetical protein
MQRPLTITQDPSGLILDCNGAAHHFFVTRRRSTLCNGHTTVFDLMDEAHGEVRWQESFVWCWSSGELRCL